ncbi:MAG: hypothetical protein IKM60_01625 [Clostridia bacterium]|nr:hypothetical protein [Clostridia bacterium]
MAYCVHCGVELAPSEKKCPLCNTKVYDPSVPEERAAVTPYPPYEPIAPERISKKSVLIVLTLIFMLPVMLSCICDFSINKRIVWAGYVAGGLLQVYALIFMSILLAGKNLRCAPMWKIGVNTFTLLGYLCYIVWVTDGQWFWRFAVPVVLIGALFIVAAILLRKFGGLTRLMTTAAVLAEAGTYCLIIELTINCAFLSRGALIWSVYPLATGWLLAVLMAVIDRSPALKERLERKFFI